MLTIKTAVNTLLAHIFPNPIFRIAINNKIISDPFLKISFPFGFPGRFKAN